MVSASSIYEPIPPDKPCYAYNVFVGGFQEWMTDNINTNFWIQIKCPVKTRIYKIALRGLDSTTNTRAITYNWKQ